MFDDTDRSGPRARRLRVAFVMEQVLGHTTWSQNLRAAVARMADVVEVRWIATHLYQVGGTIERMPAVSPLIKASVRGLLDTRQGLRGWKPDVLFFNTQKPAAFCQLQMLRTPTILMTDVTPAQYDRLAGPYDHDTTGHPTVHTIKHLTNVLNFRLARAIVPWSQWTAGSLRSEYGVPAERLHVIPPGVDTDRWHPAPEPRPDGLVKLLFVGGHFERKGGRLLLDVFRAQRLAERTELHVVTRDPVPPEPGVIVHRDIQNNADALLRLYQQADVFVLPTLADCFSIASIEAMASGLPVVTTDVGGVPDIVEHGKTGFVLPVGDGLQLGEALNCLVGDASLTATLGRNARKRAVASFDARVSAREILRLARTVSSKVLQWPTSG
jgi:glycosyltransferase involved in cell wall biosynthesis